MAVINGSSGADLLIGSGPGTGNDTLRGFQGGDTYQFSVGSGIDRVSEENGNTSQSIIDRLHFTDRNATQFFFSRSGTDLVIDAGGGDQVTVVSQFDTANPARRVEQLRDQANLTYTLIAGLTGSSGRDILVGTAANNTLLGNDGDDILFGGAGN